MQEDSRYLFPYVGLVGLVGFFLLLWINRLGPGVSPDSAIYINGARSLLSLKGYFSDGVPITQFPPFYSIVLAAVSLVTNDLLRAARVLNAILFGVDAGLLALSVYLVVRRNFLIASCAVLFFLASAPFLQLYSYALSEPLFITLTLACLILVSAYAVKPTLLLLIVSSICMGLSLITRYVGIALLPVALVIVFASGALQHFGRRIRDSTIWFVLASVPLLILLARNRLVGGSATSRSIVHHPFSLPHYLVKVVTAVEDYFAPISLPAGVRPAIFGLLALTCVALLVVYLKRHLSEIDWRSIGVVMPLSCLLFCCSYMVFLFISLNFLDAATPLDSRLLSPVLTIAIIAFFALVSTLSAMLDMRAARWFLLLFVALSIAAKLPTAISSAADIQLKGLGYTARVWRVSESVTYIRQLPQGTKVYSNGPDVLNFLTGMHAVWIPAAVSSMTKEANPQYVKALAIMCRDVAQHRAVVVYLTRVTWRWYLPTAEEIASACNLSVLRSLADGTVYSYP